MTRFLLIRHATTNAVGKHLSGRMAGVSLNEEGAAQAQQLAQRLKHLPIQAVYTSPLERAVQTAAPLAEALSLKSIIQEAFLELHFGEWTNQSFEELGGQQPFQLFNTFRSGTRIPGGETMLEAQVRIVNGLQNSDQQHPRQTIAVVSHADLIKAALAHYAGVHLDLFQRIEISPASVSIVEMYEETVRLVLVNDTGGIHF